MDQEFLKGDPARGLGRSKVKQTLKQNVKLANNSSSTSPHSPSPPVAPPDFSVFKPTSKYEVSKILFDSPNKQSG